MFNRIIKYFNRNTTRSARFAASATGSSATAALWAARAAESANRAERHATANANALLEKRYYVEELRDGEWKPATFYGTFTEAVTSLVYRSTADKDRRYRLATMSDEAKGN